MRFQTWRKSALRLKAALVMSGILAPFALGASEPSFTFRFSLPDGATFISTKTSVNIKKWEKAATGKVLENDTKVIETKTKFTVRRNENGYTLVSAPVSIEQTRNGEKVVNQLDLLFQEIVLTYDLDLDGKVIAIRGAERIEKKVKRAVLDQAIAEMTNEWNERVDPFIGRSAAYGDIWTLSKRSVLFTGKPATIRKRIRFAEPVACEGGPCIRTLHALSKEADLKGEFYADAAEALDVDVTDIDITGEGESRIDPKTMFFHYESRRWTTRIRALSPDQGDVIGTTESRFETVTEYE